MDGAGAWGSSAQSRRTVAAKYDRRRLPREEAANGAEADRRLARPAQRNSASLGERQRCVVVTGSWAQDSSGPVDV
jgi:hypothetical protein